MLELHGYHLAVGIASSLPLEFDLRSKRLHHKYMMVMVQEVTNASTVRKTATNNCMLLPEILKHFTRKNEMCKPPTPPTKYGGAANEKSHYYRMKSICPPNEFDYYFPVE
jgi:hypothetical protein